MSTDTPTDQKILVDGTLLAEATETEAQRRFKTDPQFHEDDEVIASSGPPTLKSADAPGVADSNDLRTTVEIIDDGTPTGQSFIRDATPTEKQLLSGAMAVGRGTVIDGRWRTERCLASGGYGDVWEGVDTQEDRPIAVKILRTDAGNNDPSAIARMRQEADILAAISHPNIVAVFGFGDSPFGHYLVMEMLRGKAIDQLLTAEGPLDEERAIPLVRQLLEALEVAHEKQIFHRDLKPENIIVVRDDDGTETAKLVDFGIAKATRVLGDDEQEGVTLVQTRAGGFMGTPRYAAPEQAVGDPCGPNIDLFALGLVIGEWLTGRMRIDGERHADVMQQLLTPEELDISDVPYRWREWLASMIRKNPRQRLQTARQAIEELERLVVQQQQKPEFLESASGLAEAASRADYQAPKKGKRGGPGYGAARSDFAANDGPLELDFDRARKPMHTPHPHAGGVARASARDQNTSAQLISTVSESTERQIRRQYREQSAGYQFWRIIFMLAVGIISFAACGVLIGILLGLGK